MEQLDCKRIVNNIYSKAKELDIKIGDIEKEIPVSLGYFSRFLKEDNHSLPSFESLYVAAIKLRVTIDSFISSNYDSMNEEELFEITSRIVEYLIEKDCKLIVIACNTATTSCMSKLREKYKNIIFVGTVPAIKLACDNNYKNIVNLATPYTCNSKRVCELIDENKKDFETIYNVSGENLANLVELDQNEEIDKLLTRVLTPYKDTCDALVLGCTHYSLIKERINKVLPNTILLDGAKGVSEEVKRQIINNNINLSTGSSLTIINSKDENLVKRSIEILNK